MELSSGAIEEFLENRRPKFVGVIRATKILHPTFGNAVAKRFGQAYLTIEAILEVLALSDTDELAETKKVLDGIRESMPTTEELLELRASARR